VELRGKTNAFSIGNNSIVLGLPKDVSKEFDIDTTKKKTYFDIFTEFNPKTKETRIIYVFSGHVLKRGD